MSDELTPPGSDKTVLARWQELEAAIRWTAMTPCRIAGSRPVGAIVVKRAPERVGLDPARVVGRSLRSWPATVAAAGGAPEWVIMKQTKCRSVELVRRYIRAGSLFQENAAAYVGS